MRKRGRSGNWSKKRTKRKGRNEEIKEETKKRSNNWMRTVRKRE
jgi:hypothetical protein